MGDRAPDQKQMSRWLSGRTEPRRKWWVRLLWAVRQVTGDESIGIGQIVNLDPDDPGNWRD